ncbi:DUF4382 domain-containing protein [Leptothrix discophora]|uniref:DUF4382 domain-containing protein n=1 Tax=Leptothrix discophora TaxID=89 RepID=A0ABT9G8C8_LEPDI|nr:DUF4382 domain-containing protein [Leptothrix discophora]MDP4302722.1 DUF4382 domain-containing protein [Leptothrix discophora]
MRSKTLAAIAASTLALLLTACGGGGGGIGGTGAAGNGTLRVSMTDAPSCGFDEVNVTVTEVRVNPSATAPDGTGAGWFRIVLPNPQKTNLLDLQNGVLQELGEIPLPAGTYQQMRLVLASNTGATLANSLVLTGGTGAEVALDTPSGQQSGLKINTTADITVLPGQRVDWVIDFDACKSVVRRGNSGRYNLKPVLTAFPRVTDAGLRIVGWVDPSLLAGPVSVSAQQGNGVVVKATAPVGPGLPDAGRFELPGLAAGSYNLVISAAGRVTAVITDVPVAAISPTQVNSAALPIDLPAAANAGRTVAGTVTTTLPPPLAGEVRAIQTLAGPRTIELRWTAIDADTGAWTMALPTGATYTLPYAALPVAWPFAPDAASAGRYRLEARDGSGTVKSADIDVNVAVPAFPAALTQDFSFLP